MDEFVAKYIGPISGAGAVAVAVILGKLLPHLPGFMNWLNSNQRLKKELEDTLWERMKGEYAAEIEKNQRLTARVDVLTEDLEKIRGSLDKAKVDVEMAKNQAAAARAEADDCEARFAVLEKKHQKLAQEVGMR